MCGGTGGGLDAEKKLCLAILNLVVEMPFPDANRVEKGVPQFIRPIQLLSSWSGDVSVGQE